MIEVEAHVLHLIDNQLGAAMSSAIKNGWEILYAPQYLYTGRAAGYNTRVSEHFLLIVKRDVKDSDQAQPS